MSQRTPLYDIHKSLGAKMVNFAGWEMPVEFSGITEEHLAVRQRVGLFDVSHMGEIEIRGTRALELIEKVTCNQVTKLVPGRSQYSALLTPEGTFVDDIMVYRLAPNHFFLCVNASNRQKDFAWIRSHSFPGVEVEDRSDAWALLALQGPGARKIIPTVLPKTYFQNLKLEGTEVLLSATGYTGEEGYEIFCPADSAQKIWNHLLERGKPLPCGLGARDTLRLEAGYPLYGYEIDEQTTPYEAGLDWIVKMEKGPFIGQEALRRRGRTKERIGLVLEEPGIARAGYRIFLEKETPIGQVTSGTWSPLSQQAIAMGYVTAKESLNGKKIRVDIRGKKREAMVVPLPFYRRPA